MSGLFDFPIQPIPDKRLVLGGIKCRRVRGPLSKLKEGFEFMMLFNMRLARVRVTGITPGYFPYEIVIMETYDYREGVWQHDGRADALSPKFFNRVIFEEDE